MLSMRFDMQTHFLLSGKYLNGVFVTVEYFHIKSLALN